MNQFLLGDCLQTMQTIPDDTVDCCITSPPYFGLRGYSKYLYKPAPETPVSKYKYLGLDTSGTVDIRTVPKKYHKYLCRAENGLEHHPQQYIDNLVAVFEQVKRVLKPCGTLWLNIGDSYASERGGSHQPAETLAGGKHGYTKEGAKVNRGREEGYNPTRNAKAIGLKHKDLIGIPWQLAFALRQANWYLRQDIIWHKPNCAPESVKDRCTKSHEYIFLFSKSEKYYYDSNSIKVNGANRRSVWSINPKPFKGQHFATYPPELVYPCVLAGCPKDGIVLDPFGGTGTTAMVAKQLGRQFILCELCQETMKIAKKRVKQPWKTHDFSSVKSEGIFTTL